jgi:hypothetical protein
VSDRAWQALCVALGLTLTAVALLGAGRQLAYDEAVSFGYFVATPSPFDVFGRSSFLGVPMWVISTNNHPLFNFLQHLIYNATHSRAEWVYRVLPALCGGACVSITGLALQPRFGRLGGLAAMLFLATNPLFDDESHVMRGYTLLLLIVLLSTLALWRRWGWVYAVLVALGLVAHLYFLLVLPGQAVLALRWRSFRWALPYAVGGAAVGIAAYAGLAADLAQHSRLQGQIWRPGFPIQLVAFLVGGPFIDVVALTFPLVLLGLFATRRDWAAWALLAVYVVVAILVWAVAKPAELYPRFFFFLLPGVAWLIAAGIRRWPLVIAVVVAAGGASLWVQAPGWTQDQLATRAGAAVLDSQPGGCVISHDELVLAAYTSHYRVVTDPGQLPSCPYLVAVTWELLPPVAQAASTEFPVRQVLPAAFPGLVLRRVD